MAVMKLSVDSTPLLSCLGIDDTCPLSCALVSLLLNCGCCSAPPCACGTTNLPTASASVARAYKWRQDRKFLRNLKRDTASKRRREEATPLGGSGGGGPTSTRRGHGRVGSSGAGAIAPSAARGPATANSDTANGAFPGGDAPLLSGAGGDGDGSQRSPAAAMGSSAGGGGDKPRDQSGPAGRSSREKPHGAGVDSDVDLRVGLT